MLKQARLRFDAGIASHLEVLDVERNLLAAELVRLDSERAHKAALADMFQGDGGDGKRRGKTRQIIYQIYSSLFYFKIYFDIL